MGLTKSIKTNLAVKTWLSKDCVVQLDPGPPAAEEEEEEEGARRKRGGLCEEGWDREKEVKETMTESRESLVSVFICVSEELSSSSS